MFSRIMTKLTTPWTARKLHIPRALPRLYHPQMSMVVRHRKWLVALFVTPLLAWIQ